MHAELAVTASGTTQGVLQRCIEIDEARGAMGRLLNAFERRSPRFVDSPILKDFLEPLGMGAEADMRTMDLPGRPAGIAPLVSFLLSNGCTWIRERNMPVDCDMYSNILLQMNGMLAKSRK